MDRFHLHPLDFSLGNLAALASTELSLVVFHPAATDDLNSKVFRVFSRKREAARLAGEPLSPLDFSLDDVANLSSEELALVASRFHTFAEKGQQEQAEELWFKRRETDFGTGLKWRDVPSATTIPRLSTPPIIPQIPPFPAPDDPLPPAANKLLFTLRLSNLPVKIITSPDILLSFLPTDAKNLLAAVVDPPRPEDPEFTTCAFASYPTPNARILAFQSIVGLIIHRFYVGVDFVESEKAEYKWSDFSESIGRRLYRASHDLPELEEREEVQEPVEMRVDTPVRDLDRMDDVPLSTKPKPINVNVNYDSSLRFIPSDIVDRFLQTTIKYGPILETQFKDESARDQSLLAKLNNVLGFQRKGLDAHLAFATSPHQVAAIIALRREAKMGKFHFDGGKQRTWKWSDMIFQAKHSTKRKATSEVDGERRTKEAKGQEEGSETDVGSVENRVRAQLSLPPIISLSTASHTASTTLPAQPVASTSANSQTVAALPLSPQPSAVSDPHVDERGRALPEGWTRNLSKSSSAGQCYYWHQERIVTSWTSPCEAVSGGSDEVSMMNHVARAGEVGMGSTGDIPRAVEQRLEGRRNEKDPYSPSEIPATAAVSTTTTPYTRNHPDALLGTFAPPIRQAQFRSDNVRNPPVPRSTHSSRSNSPHQADYPTGPRADRRRMKSGPESTPAGNPNSQPLSRALLNGDTVSVSIKDIAVPAQSRSRASSTASNASSIQIDTSHNPLASTSASTSASKSLLDRIEHPPAVPINPNYKGKHPWVVPPNPPRGPKISRTIPVGSEHHAGQPPVPRTKAGPPTGPKAHPKASVVAKSRYDSSVPLVDRFAGSTPQSSNALTVEVAEPAGGGLLSRISQPIKKPYSKPIPTSNVGSAPQTIDATGAELSRVAEGASRGVGGVRGRGRGRGRSIVNSARGGVGRGGHARSEIGGLPRSVVGASRGRGSAQTLLDRLG